MEDGGWRMEDGGWRMEDEYHRTATNSYLNRIYEPLFSSKTSKIFGQWNPLFSASLALWPHATQQCELYVIIITVSDLNKIQQMMDGTSRRIKSGNSNCSVSSATSTTIRFAPKFILGVGVLADVFYLH